MLNFSLFGMYHKKNTAKREVKIKILYKNNMECLLKFLSIILASIMVIYLLQDNLLCVHAMVRTCFYFKNLFIKKTI